MDEIRFSRFAAQNPDRLAVVDGAGRHWSRGEIAELTHGMSRALRAKGFVPGDVLAIFAPNCAEYLVAYLAATQIGLYVVPLNWYLAPPETRYILENSRARALVVHERFRGAVEAILREMPTAPEVRISVGELPGFVELREFVRGHSVEPLADPVQGRVLGYTSATTGRPKGVVLPLADSARILNKAIEARIAVNTLPEAHVQLCASLLYHGAPLEAMTLALHMGHVAVLMDFLSPEAILRLIDQYRVTMAYIVPAMFARLLHLSEEVRSRYSTASLKRVIHGGAMCPVDVKRRMIEWLGPILWEAYGAVEGAGTLIGATEWLKYPGSVGRPIPGTRLRIVSDDGEDLPAGEVGTIYMTRFCGDRFEYLGDPEKTRACQQGDFFTVGDVGYLNEEGFLFLRDRKIDMINLAGTKVYSAEVESVLARHPQVADCAVFGIPDEVTGEAVVALVQRVAGAPTDRELRSSISGLLHEHLSVVKHPRYLEFVAQLPRDDTGKLKKRRLREQYLVDRRTT